MQQKKFLGQHFLHDKNIAKKIVRLAQIKRSDNVLEIGPGKGILTKEILKKCNKLIAFEIDQELYRHLKKSINSEKLILINKDILKDNFSVLTEADKWKVVANIPYNITSPLIFKLIEQKDLFSTITLMMQKEVGDRLASQANTKAYGRISVKVQMHYKVRKLFAVPPSVFYPPPKVNSAVMQLWPHREKNEIKNRKLLDTIINKSFQHRRKMLRTSLKSLFSAEQYGKILEIEFDFRKRPEKLDYNEFIDLSNKIFLKIS